LPEAAVQRLLIRNGRVVDPSQGLDQGMDVLLEDGHVARIGERIRVKSETPVLDAARLVVAPGFIDLNAQLCEPGHEHRETIASGCRAAVAGGFTAVCCSPDTKPVNDEPSVTSFILERARDVGLARVHPVGAVSRGLAGAELAEIGEMVRAGAVAVGDPGPVANAQLMRRALEYARSFDIPVAAHAEDLSLADAGLMHEGVVSTRIGLRGMPAAAEEVVVARDLILARLSSGRLHLRHLSTAGALERVRAAKAEDQAVTCEVAPHHFTLTDEDVASATYNTDWKTKPPLRSSDHVDAVKQALYDGTVDAIASDHVPQHRDDKELDFSEAPFGIVGLETALALTLTFLVKPGHIGLTRALELWTDEPRRVFGLRPVRLEPGDPADLVLIDPADEWTVDPGRFQSKGRNTPFAGWTLTGRALATVCGGRLTHVDPRVRVVRAREAGVVTASRAGDR
jgi:dihydroorotase